MVWCRTVSHAIQGKTTCYTEKDFHANNSSREILCALSLLRRVTMSSSAHPLGFSQLYSHRPVQIEPGRVGLGSVSYLVPTTSVGLLPVMELVQWDNPHTLDVHFAINWLVSISQQQSQNNIPYSQTEWRYTCRSMLACYQCSMNWISDSIAVCGR